MNRRKFVEALAAIVTIPHFLPGREIMKNSTSVRLLRHATLIIEIQGVKLLIDPMLSDKDGMDPVQNCGNNIRFPMVALPVNESELNGILSDVDAIVVTHTHRDHWDAAAQAMIDKEKLIFCQPVDKEKLAGLGFKKVQAIDRVLDWKGIRINRTDGKHGTGEIGRQMGAVSGFVFEFGKKSIYLAGDSIWCDDVEAALTTFRPLVTILNTGGAKFLTGDPITMTPDDVMRVHDKLPGCTLIAVHMDTVNHCFVRRADLRNALKLSGIESKVLIPKDGELVYI